MTEPNTTTAPDVLVIGGGIVGAASAYHLARRGASVTLLEANELAYGATGRNLGYIWLHTRRLGPELDLVMHLRRELEELPGTPEQVWDAIATANGISSWFLPTDLEERLGGAVSFHMGETSSDGTITGWDPPRRIEYEEPDWASLVGREDADVTPLVTEFLVEATSGAHALELLREGVAPDLVISDYLMPGMNGAELATEIRAGYPDLPIMLASGYASLSGNMAMDLPLLAKPYRHSELAAMIKRVISEPILVSKTQASKLWITET